MNQQINLRIPENVLKGVNVQVKKQGFRNIQEFILAILREKLFENEGITKKEFEFIKKLHKLSEEKNLFRSEEELFSKLRR